MALILPYEQWGEGELPLLLLHGFTGSRRAFDGLRPFLSPHFRVLAVDLPGHGAAPAPREGPAGFEQVTYGEFGGPYFIQDPKNTRAEFVKMWKKQPQRPLPFRFGYPDQDKKNHLMVTTPKGK